MKDEKSNIEKLIKNAVKEKDHFTPRTAPDTLIALLQPQISKKAVRLRQRHKEKKENRIFTIGYCVFLVFAILLAINYLLKGSSELCLYMVICAGVFSTLLLCCLPLLIRFRGNIIERRTN